MENKTPTHFTPHYGTTRHNTTRHSTAPHNTTKAPAARPFTGGSTRQARSRKGDATSLHPTIQHITARHINTHHNQIARSIGWLSGFAPSVRDAETVDTTGHFTTQRFADQPDNARIQFFKSSSPSFGKLHRSRVTRRNGTSLHETTRHTTSHRKDSFTWQTNQKKHQFSQRS